MTLFEEFKKRIKENEITSKVLQNMLDDGLSEDQAVTIMINAYVKKCLEGDFI